VPGISDRLNKAVTSLTPPPIPLVLDWAKEYKGDYGPMLNVSQAVPGYPSHPKLYKWLSEAAASSDFSSYGAVKGDDLLRANLATHLTSLFGAHVDFEETQITSGCNQAFYAALLTLAAPGEKVLLTNPCFFNHEYSLRLLGLEPGFVDCKQEYCFVPQLEDIEAAIDHKTKALVVISPNNPTGAVYPAEDLAKIFDLCRAKGIWLVMDETYRDFLPAGQTRPHSLFQKDNWRDTLVQLYSFSKAYAIPGHRIGAVTANRTIKLLKPLSFLLMAGKSPPVVPISPMLGIRCRIWVLWKSRNASPRNLAFCLFLVNFSVVAKNALSASLSRTQNQPSWSL